MLSSLFPSPQPAGADASVKDVTMAGFVADVIEASKAALVLVDFWATWRGPCKQLTPVLEKIARESKGAIRLAKIDVDRNQPLAQQMGVQSVPSVFAFYQGRPVDGFAGALPESQIKAWLEPLLKMTGGAGDTEKEDIDAALKQAADFLAAKDVVTARAVYLDILDRDPENAAAYAGMARCAMEAGDAAQARQMLDAAPAAIAKDKALDPVRAALELAEQAGQGAGMAELEAKLVQNPADPQTRFDLAMACYAADRREDAVDHLLEIVRCNRSWNDDAARKQLVKFFEAFGPTDSLTIDARKRLSSILFS
ncbi:MAG: co-chaperone YbbN [Alphaproteobacteria bacterium]|nr:co-chaperone YbbN [Alphaproteobacteria bacterium]